jgi:ATP-dependent DNA helicase RecG
MFHDRLEIYSPGGMPDGTLIQERDIEHVPSTRRNPIIAETFHRLDYIERRGSGFNKILTETANLYGYTDAFAPEFKSTPTAFHVILKNMNYVDETPTAEVRAEVKAEVRLTTEKLNGLLEFCSTVKSRKEMQEFCGVKSDEYFRKHIVNPMISLGLIRMTIPDKPNSRSQKYIRA